MTEEKHNGYTNYETWLVSLHIECNRSLVELFTTQECDSVYDLEDMIKLVIEQIIENETNQDNVLIQDLIQATFSKVNFGEIARDFWKIRNEIIGVLPQ